MARVKRGTKLVGDPGQSVVGRLVGRKYKTQDEVRDHPVVLENGPGGAAARAGKALLGAGGLSKAERLAANVEKGKAGEEAAGFAGKAKRGVTSALGTARRRFPDNIDDVTGVLTEVKNVASQGWTKQLKDYAAIAKRDSLTFVLQGRKSTSYSPKVYEAVQRGDVSISPEFIAP